LPVGAAILAPRADAADDGRDVAWGLTDGGPAAYNAMINAVRQRATGFFTVDIDLRPGAAGDIQVPRIRLIHQSQAPAVPGHGERASRRSRAGPPADALAAGRPGGLGRR
jgi:hypothetical protein